MLMLSAFGVPKIRLYKYKDNNTANLGIWASIYGGGKGRFRKMRIGSDMSGFLRFRTPTIQSAQHKHIVGTFADRLFPSDLVAGVR